jgi:hypothetical protein
MFKLGLVFILIGFNAFAFKTYETDYSIPEGRWEGDGTYVESGGMETRFHSLISSKNNVLRNDFESDVSAGVSVDQFEYTEPQKALWLDPGGREIGACSCIGPKCDCNAKTTGGLSLSRTMTFSDSGLEIDEHGSLGAISYKKHSFLNLMDRYLKDLGGINTTLPTLPLAPRFGRPK